MNTQPDMPTPDTPQLLLEHHLKALRLPTMLREYDKVARHCAVERVNFPRLLDALRLREKAHTHEGDAIAAARWRLPTVEVDPATKLIGPQGPVTLLYAFEGRSHLIA